MDVPGNVKGVGCTLVVFAKIPRPGRVKTRLATDIGAAEAASLYRVLGRQVLDGVRGGDYRIVAYIDPANQLAQAREWLGEAGIDFRPQQGAGLGERLAHAFRQELRGTRHVCAIGTDAPGVDRHVVARAFAELAANELVLGPAMDGGYYLIGMSGHRPTLFRGVPWSTKEVLATTLARARDLKLRTSMLPPLADIDTFDDLKRTGYPMPGHHVPARGSGSKSPADSSR